MQHPTSASRAQAEIPARGEGVPPRAAAAPADRHGVRLSPRVWLLILVLLCVVVAGASLLVGAGDLADAELLGVFLRLRLARLGGALVAGASLAVGGVIVQGLFKNPLASPSILGTSAGADLGGKVALVLMDAALGTTAAFGLLRAEMLLPLGCVLGAVLGLAVLLLIHRAGQSLLVLLLTGFLLNALFGDLSQLLTTVAMERPELVRALTAFGLGDLSGLGLRRVALSLPMLAGGLLAAMLWAPTLDLMLAGEEEASALGVNVVHVRWACILWTAVLTAAAVSVGGSVAFVGLIVPHALRPLVGVQHRWLIPASAIGGGVFLVACDTLARMTPFRSEIPLGVVTGIIGAPMFLMMLLRTQRELGRV